MAIPIYNEAPHLAALVARNIAVLQVLDRSFEIILIDDGINLGNEVLSRDLCWQYPELRAVMFYRNYGQSAAITAKNMRVVRLLSR